MAAHSVADAGRAKTPSSRPEPERQRRRSGEPALSEVEGDLLFPYAKNCTVILSEARRERSDPARAVERSLPLRRSFEHPSDPCGAATPVSRR